jgi:hypothetical protein
MSTLLRRAPVMVGEVDVYGMSWSKQERFEIYA